MNLKSAILFFWLLFYSATYFTVSAQYQITLVNYNTTISAENNILHKEIELTYQIENEKSSWISDFEIPFNEGSRLSIISAEIINKYGKTVRKLKNKEIITVNDRSRDAFYQDNLIKKFSLKWHDYPYQVKLSYKFSSKDFLYISYWSPYRYSNIPVKAARLEVAIPDDLAISISSPDTLRYDSSLIDNVKRMVWQLNDLPYIKQESNSPETSDLIPWVKIIPHEFRFGSRGRLSSWKEYGNWQYGINSELLELTSAEKNKINTLLDDVESAYEQAKILYYYLQDNTRYINVSIDEGGLIPYPASYVCNNKYGDCKALTIYMMALLNYVGIESFYIDVNAGANPKYIDVAQPSQQFNHVILCLPLKGDTLWLENTANYLPFGYLGSFTEDRPVLLIEKNNSRISYTPAAKDVPSSIKSSYIKLGLNGSGNIKQKIRVRGRDFELHRDLSKNHDIDVQRRYFENSIIPSNSELTSWTYSAYSRDSTFIDMELEIAKYDLYRTVAGRKIIALPKLELKKLQPPEKRVHELRYSTLNHTLDTIIIAQSGLDSYKYSIPENFELISDFGHYSFKSIPLEGAIKLVQELKIPKQQIALEHYAAYYKFYDTIMTFNKTKNIVLINK